MTTLAYKNGVLAVDSQVSIGSNMHKSSKKLMIGNGIAVAMCGQLDYCTQLAHFVIDDPSRLKKGLHPNNTHLLKIPDLEVIKKTQIVILTKTKAYTYDYELLLGEVTYSYAAGSGDDLALGAMLNGASAVEAVKVACKVDVWTSGPVRWIDRNDKRIY